MFDLRTGKLVDIVVADPRTPRSRTACAVAGKWAAWVAVEGSPRRSSLYLADLSSGKAHRLLDGSAPTAEIALSQYWLLWTDPSGALSGFHLPDLSPVRIQGALKPGEEDRKLEISGNLAVIMVVAAGGDSRFLSPNFTPKPKWTAIRAVRLR